MICEIKTDDGRNFIVRLTENQFNDLLSTGMGNRMKNDTTKDIINEYNKLRESSGAWICQSCRSF